jgi:hypothetical protein
LCPSHEIQGEVTRNAGRDRHRQLGTPLQTLTHDSGNNIRNKKEIECCSEELCINIEKHNMEQRPVKTRLCTSVKHEKLNIAAVSQTMRTNKIKTK